MITDPCVLNPGELRHRIQILRPEPTPGDTFGQRNTSWTQIHQTWAKIEGIGSAAYKRAFKDNALASQSTDIVTIRWPGAAITIKAGMRVIFGSNVFLIQAVDNIQHRNRVVLLACMQVDSDSN